MTRYTAIPDHHGYGVHDATADALCFGLWSIHRHQAEAWAATLNEQYGRFRANSEFAARRIAQLVKEC